MRTRSVAELGAALVRWQNLDECLLTELQLLRGAYSARLVFDHIWEGVGRVRPDLGEVVWPVVLTMHGVEGMELVGGLSTAQRAEPERIGWGIAEVATVTAAAGPEGTLRVDVLWPGDRRLTIVAGEAELVEGD